MRCNKIEKESRYNYLNESNLGKIRNKRLSSEFFFQIIIKKILFTGGKVTTNAMYKKCQIKIVLENFK